MKKRILITLISIFVISLTVIAAEEDSTENIIEDVEESIVGDYDFSGYDDDELVELLMALQQEIADRKIEKTAELEKGRYVGGKDLPVGSYVLDCETDSDHHGIVWVSAPEDDLENEYPSIIYDHVSFDSKETYRFSIEEGGILYVPFSAKLTISAGVMFK